MSTSLPTLCTRAEAKEAIKATGKSIAVWSLEHGFDPNTVYRVLNGSNKAGYGRAYLVAIALGIKAASTPPLRDKPTDQAASVAA